MNTFCYRNRTVKGHDRPGLSQGCRAEMTWWRQGGTRRPRRGGRVPGTGDRASPGLLFPVLILGSESFCPECPKVRGSCKVHIATDRFSFHPDGCQFWKRDVSSEAAAQYMRSKQNGMENSSPSDLRPPPLTYALDAGDPGGAAAASGATRLGAGARPRAWVLNVRPGAICGPSRLVCQTLTLTSQRSSPFSSVKLYFSYPPFGLIYIYTDIYINSSIYTVTLLN